MFVAKTRTMKKTKPRKPVSTSSRPDWNGDEIFIVSPVEQRDPAGGYALVAPLGSFIPPSAFESVNHKRRIDL